jgi:hypothetical protein
MYDQYRKSTARSVSPIKVNRDIDYIPVYGTDDEPLTLQEKLTNECKRKLYDLEVRKRTPSKPVHAYD